MTAKEFFDWQTRGGANDVMKLIDALERHDIPWCAIGGVAVNHWADEPMVTQDFDLVVASESTEKTVELIVAMGFKADRHEWSINLQGPSAVSIQLSTEEDYSDYPSRAVAADVHGILLRVASLQDTLTGKLRAYMDPNRRPSKRLKDLTDIARLLESHPELQQDVPKEIITKLETG